MKKSNKLLLGGFLILLLIITTIHLTLYAKYKAGHYTVYNEEEDLSAEDMQMFPDILFISLENISGATVKFGDATRLEKVEKSDIQYRQKGDTLLISSMDSSDIGDHRHPVQFYLPYGARLSVKNSSLYFVTGKESPQDSTTIYLQKSMAIFPGVYNTVKLGHLRVVASENSSVLFQGTAQVNNLEVQLSNSTIESAEGHFGQLSIVTDSLSRISLPAKQLLKANIKTTTE